MIKFVKYKTKDGNEYYGLLNKDNNFIQIEGDIFTSYKITDKIINPSDVQILPPVIPSKIVAVGLNYKDHAKELNMQLPDEPIIFIKTPNTVIGHMDKIILPEMSKQVDYEAELAIIIKNNIKNIDEELVNANILGYTCLNDVTARDLQKKDGQWTRAKCFDTFAPIGPYFTKDINPDKVNIKLFLNDELKQNSNTSNFIFKTKKLISFISKIMTLNRGDIVTTGTPAGVGPLKKGDKVEVEIDGIGRLTNFVE
ncbi:MAG: fumarylacetoacetate hydrolase family protein [Candidatus Goldbacteria bacterium]|nr:fumarylacetoacetate hydrolase family protein [Candidatus Goldiibacteriota bacterium]